MWLTALLSVLLLAVLLLSGVLLRLRRRPVIPPSAPPPSVRGPTFGPGLPVEPVDEDVRFAVARPATLVVAVANELVVFAYKGDPYDGPSGGRVDQQEDVARRISTLFGPAAPRSSFIDAGAPVARGARLRVELAVPQATCIPDAAELSWGGGIHQIPFHVFVPVNLVGETLRGTVRIWCGPLIIAETVVAMPVVAADGGLSESTTRRQEIARYRKIFPSYAHADREMVDQLIAVGRATGDEYLQDVVSLRSGEVWNDRLLELIEEADIFQLFWSTRSMRSTYCRQEWEHALSLGRPRFVRPLYWEVPRAADEAAGLPPPALQRLQFHLVPEPAPLPLPAPAPAPAPAAALEEPWLMDRPVPIGAAGRASPSRFFWTAVVVVVVALGLLVAWYR